MAGAVVWLIIAVVLFLIESATYQMVCIWFSLGSLVAMAASWLNAPVWLQLLVFLLTSLLVLLLARPYVMKHARFQKSATNADRVIGQIGVVKEKIDNIADQGRATANGLLWTARSANDDITIPVGNRVRAVRIDGVKLIVEPLESLEYAERK